MGREQTGKASFGVYRDFPVCLINLILIFEAKLKKLLPGDAADRPAGIDRRSSLKEIEDAGKI